MIVYFVRITKQRFRVHKENLQTDKLAGAEWVENRMALKSAKCKM